MTKAREILDLLTPPKGADWFSVRYEYKESTWRGFRDGQLQFNNLGVAEGVMIEVFYQGSFGYASTNDLRQTSLREALVRATEQAQLAAKYPLVQIPLGAVRPSSTGAYRSPVITPHSSKKTDEVCELLCSMTNRAKISPKIVTTEASTLFVVTKSEYASTGGADIQQQFTSTTIDLTVTAQEGSEVQKRSLDGFCGLSKQCGIELLDEDLLLEKTERAATEALQLLSADECPTEKTVLLLSPDQMMLQIHESIGHPLELDRILGDERNYAGSSFVKMEDFGSLQYGTPLLNIIFDPAEEGELASYAFDDTGAPATREYLIKDGILVRGIGGLESQYRSGLPGISAQRACAWNRPAIDRIANINMEPGNQSLDEIVSGIERGVYMQTNRSWSIDDYRRKFQFGCELAYLIEEGRITKLLKNPNYRGITLDFWNSLIDVGDAESYEVYGTPRCGKGEPHQSIEVGHASPVCAFREIEVFGGAR